MYPTVRIEIVGDTVRLYNFGDHVRSDSEILSGVAAKFYVGKIQLEDGFFSSKGDFKISGTERIKKKIYNFDVTGRWNEKTIEINGSRKKRKVIRDVGASSHDDHKNLANCIGF